MRYTSIPSKVFFALISVPTNNWLLCRRAWLRMTTPPSELLCLPKIHSGGEFIFRVFVSLGFKPHRSSRPTMLSQSSSASVSRSSTPPLIGKTSIRSSQPTMVDRSPSTNVSRSSSLHPSGTTSQRWRPCPLSQTLRWMLLAGGIFGGRLSGDRPPQSDLGAGRSTPSRQVISGAVQTAAQPTSTCLQVKNPTPHLCWMQAHSTTILIRARSANSLHPGASATPLSCGILITNSHGVLQVAFLSPIVILLATPPSWNAARQPVAVRCPVPTSTSSPPLPLT